MTDKPAHQKHAEWIAPSNKDAETTKLEKSLWDVADQFRANSGLKAQEYSGPLLGLIFLRFAEARFKVQREKLQDVDRTPSARLLAELRRTGESFNQLAGRVSAEHKAHFLQQHAPDNLRLANFRRDADESLAEQRRLEATQTGSFANYLERYFVDG
jgi:type I restriction-modification system DNA methylase subunit